MSRWERHVYELLKAVEVTKASSATSNALQARSVSLAARQDASAAAGYGSGGGIDRARESSLGRRVAPTTVLPVASKKVSTRPPAFPASCPSIPPPPFARPPSLLVPAYGRPPTKLISDLSLAPSKQKEPQRAQQMRQFTTGCGPYPSTSSSSLTSHQVQSARASATQSSTMTATATAAAMDHLQQIPLPPIPHNFAALPPKSLPNPYGPSTRELPPSTVQDGLTKSGAFTRTWTNIQPALASPAASTVLRVCTYNVLCQRTIGATRELYRHTMSNPSILQWANRWAKLQEELRNLDADVFCLQEILEEHYHEYFQPFLKMLGYVGHYQKKSVDLHGDGCAIFVKKDKYELSNYFVQNYERRDPIMNKGQIAQVFRIRCRTTGASALIANTHLIFNQRRADIKLGQIMMLICSAYSKRYSYDEPVLLMGDWNMEPRSPLYQFVTESELETIGLSTKYASGQLQVPPTYLPDTKPFLPVDTLRAMEVTHECTVGIQKATSTLFKHSLALASAYGHTVQPQASTYHAEIGSPDFIFYSQQQMNGGFSSARIDWPHFRLLRVLSLPDRGSICYTKPWPNEYVPSDHIPLLAEFEMTARIA